MVVEVEGEKHAEYRGGKIGNSRISRKPIDCFNHLEVLQIHLKNGSRSTKQPKAGKAVQGVPRLNRSSPIFC